MAHGAHAALRDQASAGATCHDGGGVAAKSIRGPHRDVCNASTSVAGRLAAAGCPPHGRGVAARYFVWRAQAPAGESLKQEAAMRKT
jgi:hypothetical protein